MANRENSEKRRVIAEVGNREAVSAMGSSDACRAKASISSWQKTLGGKGRFKWWTHPLPHAGEGLGLRELVKYEVGS